MKYDIIPTIRGMNLSDLFEMSLSVPIFLAQPSIITRGNIDANIIETNSKTMNSLKLKFVPLNDRKKQMIKNNGMQIIGGLVNVDIDFATLSLFI